MSPSYGIDPDEANPLGNRPDDDQPLPRRDDPGMPLTLSRLANLTDLRPRVVQGAQEAEQLLLGSADQLLVTIGALEERCMLMQRRMVEQQAQIEALRASDQRQERYPTIGPLLLPVPPEGRGSSVMSTLSALESQRLRDQTMAYLDEVVAFLVQLQRAAIKPLLPGLTIQDPDSDEDKA